MKRCSTLKLTEWPVAKGVGGFVGLLPRPKALWYEAHKSAILSPPLSVMSPLRPESTRRLVCDRRFGKLGKYWRLNVLLSF